MPTIKKVTSADKGHSEVILAKEVASHANDPFVLKKVAKAKEMVSKIDFMSHLVSK